MKEIQLKKSELKNLPNSEAEVFCVVDKDLLATHRKEALSQIRTKLDLPGFRKGQVPENVITQKFGELYILEEAAEIIISKLYFKILEENKLRVIGKPEIKISKIAIDNDLEFSIKVSLMPEIILGDYKSISKKENCKEKEKNEVTEKELEETILGIRSFYAPKGPDRKPLPAPELTDEFVKMVGKFENVLDFKNKIKDQIQKEKEEKANQKRRTTIIEEIIKNSKIDLPELLIKDEQERMLAEFEDNLSRSKITLNEYLEKIKKGKDDLMNDWRDTATKKAKTRLILREIAKLENIKPEEKSVHDLAHEIMEAYKDADHDNAHSYAEMMITNDKVFEFLDNIK